MRLLSLRGPTSHAFRTFAARNRTQILHPRLRWLPGTFHDRSQCFSTTRLLLNSPRHSDLDGDKAVGSSAQDTKNTTLLPEYEEFEERIDPNLYAQLVSEEAESNKTENEEETEDPTWFLDPEDNTDTSVTTSEYIPLWKRVSANAEPATSQLEEHTTPVSGIESANDVAVLLQQAKLHNIKVIDVRSICDWAEYMVVADAGPLNTRYLHSVAHQIAKAFNSGRKNFSATIEGIGSDSGWILIDGLNIVVHLFTPEARQQYDLEGMWAKLISEPPEETQLSAIDDRG
ncbi:uncharacterized protein VTP21DRAFT_5928 [Calcarisporiella thermophila]|uniref:uncharacterized protein n=1 Tax=Calcarisporiella thermophila TaxID=911321 RepID=UPI003742F429